MGVSAKAKDSSDGADDPLSDSRVRYLLGAFTMRRLAEILGVRTAQLTRWAEGGERPPADVAVRLLDLEHVVAKARLVWGPPGAVDWLNSPNARFDGNAEPLAVLCSEGARAVLEALDGEMWNNYA